MQTFLFADMAGFTALTEAMGDEEAARVAHTFCEEARALLPEHEAEEIKTIGDAIMIPAPDPGGAIRLGVQIVGQVGGRHEFPVVRVGMHTGPAVERGGDWFGAAVNLAARVSGIARGGEVLLTSVTADAAGAVAGIAFEERGRVALKNVAEPVLLFAAVAQGEQTAAGMPIDPVCRMAVDPDRSAGILRYQAGVPLLLAGVRSHLRLGSRSVRSGAGLSVSGQKLSAAPPQPPRGRR